MLGGGGTVAAAVALLVLAGRLRAVPDPTLRRTTARARRPRPGDAPQLAATGLLLALVATPVVALVVGSFREALPGGGRTWSLANYRALTGDGDNPALLVPVTEALVTSLRIAVDATWMALLLGGLLALLLKLKPRLSAKRKTKPAKKLKPKPLPVASLKLPALPKRTMLKCNA